MTLSFLTNLLLSALSVSFLVFAILYEILLLTTDNETEKEISYDEESGDIIL